jgi:hypothetical protein
MNTGRILRTSIAGVAATLAWAAAEEISKNKTVRVGTMLTLFGVATIGLRSANKDKKVDAIGNRLGAFLDNGGYIGGPLHVDGDHTVTGDAHLSGDHYVTGSVRAGNLSMGGVAYFNGHNLDNISEINSGGQTWGAHGPLYMNGHDIHMQGGSVLSDA